jgi:ABC-type bacteriocin/lantibiotic exporter with double-glycine peptidase domain
VSHQPLTEQLLCAALPSVPKTASGILPGGLYRYVWRVSGAQQIRLLLLTFAVFPLAMVPLEFQRRIVDEAVAAGDMALILWLGAGYLGVVLLHAVLKYTLNVYQGRVSEGVVRLLRRRIGRFDIEEGESGRHVSMMAQEAERLGGFVGESLSFPLLHFGIVIAIVGYMLVVQPLMALVSVGILGPTLVWAPLLQSRLNKYAEQWTEELRALGDEVTEEKANEAALDSRIEGLYVLRNHFYVVKFVLKGLNNLIGHLGPLVIVVFGGWLVIQGETEVGTIVAFVTGFERIIDPSRQLLNFYRRFSQMRVQYRLVREAVPQAA